MENKMFEKRLGDALIALADVVLQFSYGTKFYSKNAISDGGLSALENAFWVLRENGCKVNSNGTIQVKNLLEFIDNLEKDDEKSESNDRRH